MALPSPHGAFRDSAFQQGRRCFSLLQSAMRCATWLDLTPNPIRVMFTESLMKPGVSTDHLNLMVAYFAVIGTMLNIEFDPSQQSIVKMSTLFLVEQPVPRQTALDQVVEATVGAA